jgi:hypothetical protein
MKTKIDRSEPVRGETRIPVSSSRAPLRYAGLDKENFYYRWVIDRDDRISRFLDAGYTFVKPHHNIVGESTVETGKQDGSRVKKSAAFGGFFLYLMCLPIELYNEDQAAKQREVDEIENTMRQPGKGKAVGEEIDYGKVTLERGDKVVKA